LVTLPLKLCSFFVPPPVEPPRPEPRPGCRHILEELRELARATLEQACATAGECGAAIETEALEGEAEVFEQLAELAARTPELALVIGSFGHGARERHILGSTTQRLLVELARRELATPVLAEQRADVSGRIGVRRASGYRPCRTGIRTHELVGRGPRD
jgi:hypothetical protein